MYEAADKEALGAGVEVVSLSEAMALMPPPRLDAAFREATTL